MKEKNRGREAAYTGGVSLLISIVGTFVVLRLWLAHSPESDFNVGRYNIHHLFTGLVLVAVGGVPLALLEERGRVRDAARVVFGVGLGMALDEWVYLIATDGTNASYLLPVSFWGGVVVIGLVCVYVLVIMGAVRRRE